MLLGRVGISGHLFTDTHQMVCLGNSHGIF